ncbi:MAG: nicotinate-nucleotide adenylyltransferase [Chitinispirillales bacterium]|jgi:nicotinate-nucleotide adenylyltransferase|nr:nicotinate-nucleotide adenylyltransferase [Chitinispirillales bacterium]
MLRIGILGGVFDPVHCGHLAVALLAREHFELKEVIFVPSGAPPHKSAVVVSPDDRLNMLKLALVGVEGCGVWDGELRRSGYSYTIDTINELSEQYKGAKFYFIIGTDNLPEIAKWRSYEGIMERVTFCVAFRPGYEAAIPEALAAADIKMFPGPMWGSSSTMLREYLGSGHSCKFMIPDAVLKYIREKELYGYSQG